MGKRGLMNIEANKIMKKWCEDNDIVQCEICGGSKCHNYFLTFCHRQKRRNYQTVEELSDPQQFILAGMECHQAVEYNRDELEKIFCELR